MALLSYWTIPYVSIDDIRLVYLYNIGFVCIIGSLFCNIFLHMTYLHSDNLHGITEARLKTPPNWSPNTKDDPFCQENLCVKWDGFEVGYSYTSDSMFVSTRIIDSLENSTCNLEEKANFRLLGNYDDAEEDTIENIDDKPDSSSEDDHEVMECAEYKRISKKKYYPYKVDDFYLILNANAEALEFCSPTNLPTNSREGESKPACPYVYATRKLPGELVSYNGTVLRKFNKDQETEKLLKEVPVSTFLEAAGVGSLSEDKLRDRGGVFMITIQFHLDHSKLGYFTGLTTNPEQEKLPTKFTIHVNRLAQAGYKVREVVSHTRNQRRVRTYYGLHFKLVVAGKAEKFSWSKLLSEIVLNFGLFGVISAVLDLLWQIVFPLVGFPDYNDLVYSAVTVENTGEEEGDKDDKKQSEN